MDIINKRGAEKFAIYCVCAQGDPSCLGCNPKIIVQDENLIDRSQSRATQTCSFVFVCPRKEPLNVVRSLLERAAVLIARRWPPPSCASTTPSRTC